MAATTPQPDTDISVAFKIGHHTFHLLLPSLSPWPTHTARLLTILRSRYPNGILGSATGPISLPPQDAKWTVHLFQPKNEADLTEGWTQLSGEGTPVSDGVGDGGVVGFVVAREEEKVSVEDVKVDVSEEADEEEEDGEDGEGEEESGNFDPDMDDEEIEAMIAKARRG